MSACRETAGTPPTTRWVPGKRAAAKKESIATGPSRTAWTKTNQVGLGVSHSWMVVVLNLQPPDCLLVLQRTASRDCSPSPPPIKWPGCRLPARPLRPLPPAWPDLTSPGHSPHPPSRELPRHSQGTTFSNLKFCLGSGQRY